MKVKDPGHVYEIDSLDGGSPQTITFVKRVYPAGVDEHVNVFPGTNCQEVLRVLNDRVNFLNNELPHWVNPLISLMLKACIWLFECRAASRKQRVYFHSLDYAAHAKTCQKCGHTQCDHVFRYW